MSTNRVLEDHPLVAWECPPYNLEKLKAEARARLLAQGQDPKDSLLVYKMVTRLRGEELRRKLPVLEGQVLVPAERRLPESTAICDECGGFVYKCEKFGHIPDVERRLPAVPEARSAKEVV